MKCRFLHYYQLIGFGVLIYSSFPDQHLFMLAVRTGTSIPKPPYQHWTPHLLRSLPSSYPLDLFFTHSCCLGAGLPRWLLWALVLKKQRFPFWFGDQDSELGRQQLFGPFPGYGCRNTGHPPTSPRPTPTRKDRWKAGAAFSNCVLHVFV